MPTPRKPKASFLIEIKAKKIGTSIPRPGFGWNRSTWGVEDHGLPEILNIKAMRLLKKAFKA